MFAGYFEVSISFIVKDVRHVGIIRAFVCLGDLLSFSVFGETEKIAGLWFATGGSVPKLTL